MSRNRVCRLLFGLLVSSSAGAGADPGEPPGAWYLNARGTGSDFVYFTVGGDGRTPPASDQEVRLGWSWIEGDGGVDLYPDPGVRSRYRRSTHPSKKARAWRFRSEEAGFPAVAVGPGRELVLLAEAGAPQAVRAWADLLDAVEAAYRQASPDVEPASRTAELVVRRLGSCPVRSRPAGAEVRPPEWPALVLAGHAQPSLKGGYYHVDPSAVIRQQADIRVRRFLRWVDAPRPRNCFANDRTLRLFPTPKQEPSLPDHFLRIDRLDIREASFLDLAATPWLPGFRVTAPAPAVAPEAPVIVEVPAGDDGWEVDLCRFEGAAKLCAADLEQRRRLYTGISPGEPLIAACEESLRAVPGVAGLDDCRDPESWMEIADGFRVGYGGSLQLGQRLTSRVQPGTGVE